MRVSSTLPHDIIFQHILIHLPPKILVTFLSVSKTWFSTIINPTFISMHLDHVSASTSHSKSHFLITPDDPRPWCAPPGTCSLIHEDTLEDVELELPQRVESSNEFTLIGSVNGLVCFNIKEAGFYIWNPFIRTGMEIPPNPSGFLCGRFTQCMGFGFDPHASDYKIIVIPLSVLASFLPSISISELRGDGNIYMYSLNSNSWKQVQSPDEFLEDFLYEYDQGVSFDGSMYWLASSKGTNPIKRIVSFNFEQESFRDIMFPNYESEEPEDDFGSPTAFSIQVIKHSIHLSIIPCGRSHCHVWMLKDCWDTNVASWAKQCKVVFPEGSWLVPENFSAWRTGLMLHGRIWVCTTSERYCPCQGELHHYLLFDSENRKFMDSKKSQCWYHCTCLTESLVGLAHRENQS